MGIMIPVVVTQQKENGVITINPSLTVNIPLYSKNGVVRNLIGSNIFFLGVGILLTLMKIFINISII